MDISLAWEWRLVRVLEVETLGVGELEVLMEVKLEPIQDAEFGHPDHQDEARDCVDCRSVAGTNYQMK
jgi:hypothetical protein